jgi:hypothetical protein
MICVGSSPLPGASTSPPRATRTGHVGEPVRRVARPTMAPGGRPCSGPENLLEEVLASGLSGPRSAPVRRCRPPSDRRASSRRSRRGAAC